MRGKIFVALMMLSALCAGGFAGWTLSPFRAGDDVPAQEDQAAISEPEMTELGVFAMMPKRSEGPIVFLISVSANEGASPSAQSMRDDMQSMLSVVSEMPLIISKEFGADEVSSAITAMASEAAPWLRGVTVSRVEG